MIENIKNSLKEAQDALNRLLSSEDTLFKIEQAAGILIETFKNGKRVFSCGNGGSMCDAMHFAEELSGVFREKRPALPALSISDPSHITCTANDYSFDEIFSRYVEGVGQEGDVLLAISTSWDRG